MSALPLTHRAWAWQGSADPLRLQLLEQPLPALEPGDVLVRNSVIALNPVDWKVLDGRIEGWQPGHIPGVDGAGVVVAVADDVPAAWLGQRVAYHQHLVRHGSFAEYTPLRARALLRIPASVSWAEAASVPCPALTAWLAIEKLPAHCQTLLLSGAGGSVAHHLIQFAVRRGLQVTALSHARHRERLRGMGVAQCLPGPLEQPWQGELRVDAAIDTVSGDHARLLLPALRANGHLVCVQDRLDGPASDPFTRTLSVHEVALGAAHGYGDARTWQGLVAAGEGLLNALGHGQWRPDVHHLAAFDTLNQQLHGLQHRTFHGKALLAVNPPV